jgi:hypothetical protein
VTDLALQIKRCQRLFKKTIKGSAQVSGEIDVEALVDSQMIAEQLQGDDVEQTLETVDCLRHADSLDILCDAFVIFVAYDNGMCLAGSNLGEGRLDLGIKRVTCHDDDHGHVFIDKGERAVLQLASENTWKPKNSINTLKRSL